MQNRQQAADSTRRRIIDAARELLAIDGAAAFHLDTLARRSGVSRPTIYHQFGSREGLVEALVADAEERGNLAQVIAAASHTDPVLALINWLREAVRFWFAEQVVLGAAMALAETDPEIRSVIDRHDEARMRRARSLIQRIHAAGALRTGSSQRDATELAWLLTGYRALRDLTRTGRSPNQVAVFLIATVSAVVIEPHGQRPSLR